MPPGEAIARLGRGWIAEEALAIGVYCAKVARDLREGIVLAVNHGGDSDSTGSIAGNLLGAMHGVDAIPPEWLEALELREVVSEVAGDLFDCRNWDLDMMADESDFERAWEKYPGW